MRIIFLKWLALFSFIIVSGCSVKNLQCDESLQECLPQPGKYIAEVDAHQKTRTWIKQTAKNDHLPLAMQTDIPTQDAKVKFVGPSQEDALRSLAVKIWLIENAKYSVDATYYIFQKDLSGLAIIGALCNAVKRGVDVRLMVDSVGSLNAVHSELKALTKCTKEAGYLSLNNQLSNTKARAQTVVFNALSKVFIQINRRSHDKLLVVDGIVPEHTFVMTGGRNISLDYFALKADGTPDPTAFKDIEVIIRPPLQNTAELSVGALAEKYFNVIFTHKGNKLIRPIFSHFTTLNRAQKALDELKTTPSFAAVYNEMPKYLNEDFTEAKVRLAHELGNLEDEDVVASYIENQTRNPNSIVAQLNKIDSEEHDIKTVKIVSPYLFLAEYKTPNGEVLLDEKRRLYDWLAKNPERKIEIITNSVLTSDNFLAQAMIDMDTAPRMLLSPEDLATWRDDMDKGEENPDFLNRPSWQEAINHPQIEIYQVGLKDTVILGGEQHYGKLHAKFIVSDDTSFVGTTNLDYRSRLYNNEMGYFIKSVDVSKELNTIFEDLKSISYRWGSTEWLEMRKELRSKSGYKARTAKRQRKTYTNIILTGLKWQI